MLQAFYGRFKQTGCCRQEDCQALLGLTDLFRQFLEPIQRSCIKRLIAESVQEFCHSAASLGGHILFQSFAGEVAEFHIGHFRPSCANDLQIRSDQAVSMQRAERRQKHTLREVTCGPEQQDSVSGKLFAACRRHFHLNASPKDGLTTI